MKGYEAVNTHNANVIKNRVTLASHGDREGREVVLRVLEAGLAAPDPYENVTKMVRVDNRKLIVGHPDFSASANQEPLVFDLDKIGNIYVVGGGKAVQREAEALEDVLGDLITDGQINAKKGDTVRLKRIRVTLAGHPIPDEDSVEGATRMLGIEKSARKGDIVFWCNSGGGTALQALPVPGITLADLQEVYRVLYFGCGANMPAANAVRNQLALLRMKHPRYVGDATLIHIMTEENPPSLRTHLFGRDKGIDPYDAAIGVLKQYDCWHRVPESVRVFLSKRNPAYGPIRREEIVGKPHYHFRVMGPEYMLEAARRKAQKMGLNSFVLASSLSDVEAAPAADTLAYMAQEVEVLGQPFQPPCVLICGGELVVTVGDSKGVGGRNQEFALASALRIAESENIVIASADSDGADGTTDVAGAIVDGHTIRRATESGFDVAEQLRDHNSNAVLAALGDTINTGVRQTNVRDLRVIYIGGRRSPDEARSFFMTPGIPIP